MRQDAGADNSGQEAAKTPAGAPRRKGRLRRRRNGCASLQDSRLALIRLAGGLAARGREETGEASARAGGAPCLNSSQRAPTVDGPRSARESPSTTEGWSIHPQPLARPGPESIVLLVDTHSGCGPTWKSWRRRRASSPRDFEGDQGWHRYDRTPRSSGLDGRREEDRGGAPAFRKRGEPTVRRLSAGGQRDASARRAAAASGLVLAATASNAGARRRSPQPQRAPRQASKFNPCRFTTDGRRAARDAERRRSSSNRRRERAAAPFVNEPREAASAIGRTAQNRYVLAYTFEIPFSTNGPLVSRTRDRRALQAEARRRVH